MAAPTAESDDGNYGPCPPGYYCPEATAEPIPCPPGTYSSVAKLTDLSECTPCDAGSY